MKKIISIILLLALALSLIPTTAAAETSAGGLMNELKAFSFDGKAWDISNYPKNTQDTNIYIIAVDEKQYRQDGDMSGFCLYLYLYNPSGKTIRHPSNSNKVQMAVAWDENGDPLEYEKYGITCVETSSDTGYENVFMKYAIVDRASTYDGTTIKERVAKAPYTRLYAIAGVELIDAGGTITDYGYGAQIKVSGYDEGCAQGDALTKTITYTPTQTLELDVQQCFWRTQTSSKGAGWKHQITGAYFSVPNDVWDKYQELYSIKCEWEEHHTSPMIITDDNELYTALSEALGVTNTSYSESIPYSLYSALTYHPSVGTGLKYDSANYAYNPFDSSAVVGDMFGNCKIANRINVLAWLPRVYQPIELGEESVSAKRLLSYYTTYKNHPTIGPHLLLDTVDEGREDMKNGITVTMGTEFDLSNYDSTHGWWQKVIDYNLFNGGLTLEGFTVDTGETYDLNPIEVFRSGDEKTKTLLNESTDYIMVEHFFSDADQAADFREYVAEAVDNDETVVLFRFASTDYFSETMSVYPEIEGHAYVSQQTMFLNFDVIQLQFMDNAKQIKTVAVVSDPQDVLANVTSPDTSTDFDLVVNQFWNDLNKLMDDFADVLRTIILIMLVVALVPLASTLHDVLARMFSSESRQKQPRGRQRHLRQKVQGSERKKK